MLKAGHLTAVTVWRGERYFHDGLPDTNELRLVPVQSKHYCGQEGSYAIYLLC